jgi:tRNA-2-methylthio-N6-dimethylallyladenosine synthase
MNVYDSQRLHDALVKEGHIPTDNPKDADLIVLNTCAVRQKATHKIFSQLGRYNKVKKKDAKTAVIGCVAKEAENEIFKRAPYVNYVFGPQSWHILLTALKNETKAIDTEYRGIEKFDSLTPSSNKDFSGFVSIMEGCDNYCTYCIVPYTRGREVSRPFDDIMDEVKNLVKNGVVEINFLGQNVNNYKHNNKTLVDLVKETAKLEEIKIIRFTTSYPSYLTDEQIELFATTPKLVPFIYLPIQAGSNRILKRMNRRYTKEEYLETIEKLKKANKDIQISSDFIVGFPSETEQDFQDTLDIVKKVKFITSFSFKYSPRPHTAAYILKNQIDENVKEQRLKQLQTLLLQIQKDFNQSCVGKSMDVLIEGYDKTKKNLTGRTIYMQNVIIKDTPNLIGKIVKAEITSATNSSLRGKIE